MALTFFSFGKLQPCLTLHDFLVGWCCDKSEFLYTEISELKFSNTKICSHICLPVIESRISALSCSYYVMDIPKC